MTIDYHLPIFNYYFISIINVEIMNHIIIYIIKIINDDSFFHYNIILNNFSKKYLTKVI